MGRTFAAVRGRYTKVYTLWRTDLDMDLWVSAFGFFQVFVVLVVVVVDVVVFFVSFSCRDQMPL